MRGPPGIVTGRSSRLAWLPIPLLLAAILALRVAGPQIAHESQLLLVSANLLTSTLVSLLVAVLVGRSYLGLGSPGLLLFGCGVLLWGAAGTTAPVLLGRGGNVTITVHNLLVWLSALCHLGGVLASSRPWRTARRRGAVLALAYAAVAAVVWLVVLVTLRGRTPLFFVEGLGGTPLRATVLGSAAVLFAATAAVLWYANRPSPSAFVRWYAAGMLLIATGLLGVLLQTAHGSWLSWTGRGAQFLGGAYMLIAAVVALREAPARGLSLATALRRSEERYRSLVDLSPDAIVVHQDGRFVFANRSAARLYGASSEQELLGRRVLDLVPPGDREHVRSRIETSLGGESTPLRPTRVVRLDGRSVDVESTATPTDFEGRPAVLVVLRDVTERSVAEARLAQQALMLANVSDAVIGFDMEHRVTFWSESAERMFGYTAREALGRPGIEVLRPTYPGMTREEVRGRLEAHGSVEVEFVGHAKDGRALELDSRTQVVRDGGGAPVGMVAVNRDVTGRKRAERALRESDRLAAEAVQRERDLLQAVMNSTGDSHLAFLDRDFNFVRVNETYARGCGYRPEEMVGKNHFALYPHAENEVIFRRVRDTGEPTSVRDRPFEFPDQPRRGVTYWDWTLTPVKDGGGLVAGLVLSLFETTARKRAEEELRASHERVDTILRSITDAFFALDRQWRFTYVNEESARQLRRSVPDLLGHDVWDLFPGADAFRSRYETAVASGRAEHFVEFYEPLGTWFEVHAYPSADGLSVYHRDVTARRRAEEQAADAEWALRRSEARLGLLSRTAGRLLAAVEPQAAVEELCREVMEHLDCQVFVNFLVDAGSGRLRLNACAGVPEGEASRIEWLEPGVAICGCVARDRRRITAEDILHSDDRRADLVRSWGVQAYCCHPLLERDRVLGTLSFGTRTRARFTDEEVELMRTVADQVATAMQRVEAAHALEHANARLREADRRKDEFLAVLSHELRNPLAPIRNSLYVLDRAAPGGEQARRALRVIDRQVAQLSTLVNDLLDVTRITQNRIRLQPETLELNDAVCRALEDNRSLFEQAGVRLEMRTAPEPIHVRADATRLAQIVGNLLQNSAKFTPAGGHTRVSVSVEDAHGALRVSDDGVGMTPETLARLFEPFMQADQGLDRGMGGLGIGLALVKGLVELHGGSITGHSAGLGHGAEFLVRLPRARARTDGRPGVPPTPPRRGRRVLVIEDNADAAESLRELLELTGHAVQVAHDGPSGVARARSFRPEVVLCDIGLPGMDGYEVARAFRRDPALRGMRLIALSGYALPEDLRLASAAGFELHLAKPPSFEQLSRALAVAPDGNGQPPSRP